MSSWGNTDKNGAKPKWSVERQVRDFVSLTLSANATSNVLTFSGTAVANAGIANGMFVTVGSQAQSPVPGFFAANTTVTNVTSNTVTLSQNVLATAYTGTIVEFDKQIVYKTNTQANTYNQSTVLVTPTRLANAVFAGGAKYTSGQLANTGAAAAHTGWVHVTTGTGGRAGRVQTEVLVALAHPVASNTLSGNTSNSMTYYAGV